MRWAGTIWGASVLNVEMSPEEPAKEVLASLAYDPRGVWASGNHLVKRAPRYVLRVSSHLLEQSPVVIEQIVIHEVCHLGYPRHDADFRALVTQYGGALSEQAAMQPGVMVQRKVGARYQTIATFATEAEARAWALEEIRRTPGSYRLSM